MDRVIVDVKSRTVIPLEDKYVEKLRRIVRKLNS